MARKKTLTPLEEARAKAAGVIAVFAQAKADLVNSNAVIAESVETNEAIIEELEQENATLEQEIHDNERVAEKLAELLS